MFTIIKGNIFKNTTEDCVLMHGCNAQGVMASGIALEVKKRFPSAYHAYLDMSMKLGNVSYASEGKFIIANCITQEYYGRDKTKVYVDYNALKKCCDEVADNYSKIILPMIGGGLGNGNHDTLLEIFNESFKHNYTKAILYEQL